MIKKLSEKMIYPLVVARGLTPMDSDYEILLYHFELLLANGFKFVVLLILALPFGIVPQIAVFMISYSFLRLYSFGIHLEHDITCLLIGLLYYIGGAVLAKVLIVTDLQLVICYGIVTAIFYRYAPAGTKIRPIGFFERTSLRNISCIGVFLVYLTAYFLPGEWRTLLLLSSVAQCINILPFTYWAVDKIHLFTKKKGEEK